jgi:hypothetical protein
VHQVPQRDALSNVRQFWVKTFESDLTYPNGADRPTPQSSTPGIAPYSIDHVFCIGGTVSSL